MREVIYSPTYSEDDLNQLLRRHTGRDPDCGCNCPYTGHSINILIRFVGIENDLPEWLISGAIYLFEKIAEKGCIIGNRKVTAAAIVYTVYILLLEKENIPANFTRGAIPSDIVKLTQPGLGLMFFITPVAIRNRYKRIYYFSGFDKEFWDKFKEKLPDFDIPRREKKETSLDDVVRRCLSCGYMECRCGEKKYENMTRRESNSLRHKYRRNYYSRLFC